MSDDERPDGLESADSAQDDAMADQLAIDDSVDLHRTDPSAQAEPAQPPDGPPPVDSGQAPAAAPEQPPTAPPVSAGPRHARRRSAAPEDNLRTGPENEPAATSAGEPTGSDGSPEPPSSGRRWRGKAKQPNQRRRKAPWWELPALALFAILIAVLVKTFVVQPFFIPSASMEKTLHGCPGCSGDRILVNKPIYDLRDPHGGDIVVFHAPTGWDDEPASKPPSNPIVRAVRGFGQLIGFVPPDGLVLVKRVIATGGQTVKGDSEGNVYVSKTGPNGLFRKLTEPYVFEDGTDGHAQFGPVTVPKGRLWVMGDHRNDSADSRFHCDASGSGSNDGPDCDPMSSTVPISKVIGKAVIIAWPPSRWRTLGTPSTFKQVAMAGGGALPAAGSMAFALPIWFARRRRRRHPRRPRRS